MPVGTPWPLALHPNGCACCNRTDVKYGHAGLCVSHAKWARFPDKIAAYRIKYADAIAARVNARYDGVKDVPSFVDAEPRPSLTEIIDAANAEPVAGGEQRPGSHMSSSPDDPIASDVAAPRVASPTADVPPANDDSALNKLGRVLGFGKDKKKDAPPPPPPAPPDPNKPTPRRKSIAEDTERLFSAIGAKLTRVDSNNRYVGRHAGLGNYLQWNAPATGEVLEENLANTYVDRKVLQPLVRAEDKFAAIGAVTAPPLLILAIESNPRLITPLYYPLYWALEASLDTLLPARKKAEARAKKRADNIRENFPNLPPDVDPVRAIIQDMFPWADFGDDGETVPSYPEPPDNESEHSNGPVSV